ncbi:MAG: glycosyltransferase family 1 protein [Dethiobacteria bacterium]
MSYVNVLVVASTEFKLNGITNVILNYYRNVNKQNIRYHFATNNNLPKHLLDEMKNNNSKVYQLPSRSKKPLHYALALKKVIDNGDYDIVHAHGNSATLYLEIFIAKKCGVPVRIAHSHNSTCKYKVTHYILKPFFLNSITHAFACSHKAGKWLYGDNYMVLKNGIELNRFIFNQKVREEYRKKLGILNKKVIGHIGHFSYQKNHEFLLDIFYEVHKQDNNYVLLLIGDGTLRKHIEEKVYLMGLENYVIFLGETTEIPQLLCAMDLLVFPSHFEGLPLTLIEAQASGLKCLISDVISTEVQVTDLIDFISIQLEARYWAEKVISTPICIGNRKVMSDSYLNILRNNGYDIETNAEELTKFYLEAKYL